MKLEKHFSIHFNYHLQKSVSIAIAYSSRMQLVNGENYSSMTVLTFLKNKFSIRRITVALVYKSPKSLVTWFVNQLSWLADVKTVKIFLGDFNVDALCNEAYAEVDNVLADYVLMVTEHTHLHGGFIGSCVSLETIFSGKTCKF